MQEPMVGFEPMTGCTVEDMRWVPGFRPVSQVIYKREATVKRSWQRPRRRHLANKPWHYGTRL